MKITQVVTILTAIVMLIAVIAYLYVPTRGVPIITSDILSGYDKCNLSDGLKELKSNLVSHGTPIRKNGNVWTYKATGKFFSFTVDEIETGVCDTNGDLACGWGYYTGLIIKQPYKIVRDRLKKETEVDFSALVRADEIENEVTLQPYLYMQKGTGYGVLMCDSGSL